MECYVPGKLNLAADRAGLVGTLFRGRRHAVSGRWNAGERLLAHVAALTLVVLIASQSLSEQLPSSQEQASSLRPASNKDVITAKKYQ